MAKRKNITPWFPGSVKPVHVGVYLRKVLSNWESYSYWNGEQWCQYGPTPDVAALYKNKPSIYQNFPWAGLTACSENLVQSLYDKGLIEDNWGALWAGKKGEVQT
jgi:hypothetical protein